MQWRDAVASGKLDCIDVESVLAEGDVNEIYELRKVLELIVPIIPSQDAGDGPLADPVRARLVDGDLWRPKSRKLDCDSFLTRYVKQGGFYDGLCRAVRSIGMRPPARFASLEDEVRELNYAAYSLELIELVIDEPIDSDPDDAWLRDAERVGHEVLSEEGIEFRGLDATWVALAAPERVEVGTVWKMAATNVPGAVPLRELANGPAIHRRSKVRLAVELLVESEAARITLNCVSVRPSDAVYGSCTQPDWDDRDMLVQSHLMAKHGVQIGQRLEAIRAKRIEEAAARGLRTIRASSDGGRVRSRTYAPLRSKIIRAMNRRMREAPSERAAARLVVELDLPELTEAQVRGIWRAERRQPGSRT